MQVLEAWELHQCRVFDRKKGVIANHSTEKSERTDAVAEWNRTTKPEREIITVFERETAEWCNNGNDTYNS